MKIIDNFLEEEYFNTLADLICSTDYEFAWFYGQYNRQHSDALQYFFTHMIYNKSVPQSSHFDLMKNLCSEIDAGGKGIKALLRIRANYFPNTSTLHEYEMHTDYEFSHTAALLSLNTCDGYTKIADGTKIDSVANRVVLFDAGEDHCSTTTTNAKARFNLIVNYL